MGRTESLATEELRISILLATGRRDGEPRNEIVPSKRRGPAEVERGRCDPGGSLQTVPKEKLRGRNGRSALEVIRVSDVHEPEAATVTGPGG